MLPRFLSPALILVTALQQPPEPEDPRAIVRTATRAIEEDNAARVQARWQSRAGRPNDRAARLGLATLARLQYNYAAAESTYRALIAAPSDRVSIYAHLGLAEGYEARGLVPESQREYERARAAARALGDRTAEGEALMLPVLARRRLEGNRVAQALLDTASSLIPDTAHALQARLQNRSAIVQAVLGRPAEASRAANTGIELARRAGDLRAEAEGWRVLGQVLQYRGQWDSALVALQQSQERYLKARSRSELASSLVWHAQVLGAMGRFGEVREVMRRALVEGEATHNRNAVGDAHRAFGMASAMLGDWPGAASHFRQSASISSSIGDSSGLRTTTKFLGDVALVAGDLATAKRIHQGRLARARRVEDALERYQASRDLAGIALREDDFTAIDSLMAEARSQLPRLPGGNYPIWLGHDEARYAIARDRLDQAATLLDSVARSAGNVGGNIIRFDARVRLADIAARRGDATRAEAELTGATDEIELWRASLTDMQLRTLAFQVVTTLGSSAADPNGIEASAARALAVMAREGRVEAAFSLAERWRARVLMDRLARTAALRTGGPAPGGARLTASARGVPEIVGSLRDRQVALLEYVVAGDAPITVFIVQSSGVQAVVLPPVDSLSERVSRHRALIESGADAAQLGRSLGASLLDSALARLDPGVTRVILAPDGPLHRLAFDVLRLVDGRNLIERYALGFAPSASVLSSLRAHARTPETDASLRLLALGDPKVRMDAPSNLQEAGNEAFLATARAAGGLPRLRGAAREARLVGRYAPASDVRLGTDANAEFLKGTDLRSYRVLHFATHAVVDERSVAGTALILAPGRGESGFVGVGDLAALQMDADLVVLSSCTSAGGSLAGGEGLQGLTSSLLQAGSRAVVATGWRINDQAVVPLVESFYTGLAKKQAVIDALRDAKLHALRSGAAPATWAAFMVAGDPLVTVPLRPPQKSWWSALLGR